ncbi:hypothetical protein A0H81_11316 [Grifola frondosa]|uniref:Uncharacterized protein n=1 Tax=Grifola frondosa TaxID=5627 RepID=A0A1C7LW62_GRIFR|nr:hypothetical protein A0H81_11316 [Grifola frondosa]
MFSFKIFLAAFAAVASTAVHATPVDEPVQNVVFSPPITAPTAGMTWPIGSEQVVTWDTSVVPAGSENQTGLLLLGYLEDNSEHLDIQHPLANNFPISAGSVQVLVPNVTTRNDYIVVLFGDSGNISPEFTII